MASRNGGRGGNSSRSGRGGHSNRNFRSNAAGRINDFGTLMDNSSRVTMMLVLFGLIVAVFFVRLFYLQVIVAGHYSAMAEESRTISFETTARRGTIYDRNGNVLATSVDATTVYANPSEVKDVNYTAIKVAEILGGEAKDYEEKLKQNEMTFAYIKRQADVDAAEKLQALKLEGIYFIEDTRREYPYKQVGGQVVGYCNVDGEGITGLELEYDDVLRGTNGTYKAERGVNGIPMPGGVKLDQPAVDGVDIMVSIDIDMQEYLEQRITQTQADVESEGATALLYDGGTGEIYAAASLPLMNPADMKESEAGSDQLKCITQAFEPGSIFKTVSALAVRTVNAVGVEEKIFCPAELEANEYVITDSHERSDEEFTLREIMNKSSNVGISLAVEKAGFQVFYDTIVKGKLTEATGVDYPGESAGIMQEFDTWSKIAGYNITFGQGLTVTPLQVARFYGSLVNNGVEASPHFLISYPQTSERPQYESEKCFENQSAIDDVNSMLTTVVTDGTGTAAAIDGYTVAGKTGTAEIAVDGKYTEVYNLSFVGYLPKTNSKLVCFVAATNCPYERNVTSSFSDIMSYAVERYKISPK